MCLLVHATDLYVKAEKKDLSICVDSGVQQGLCSGGVCMTWIIKSPSNTWHCILTLFRTIKKFRHK